jgi:4-hydroxythreonine-4-phosphate dehydrogenase
MLLVGGRLRVALVTIHCALREVPDRITREAVRETLGVLDHDLRERFALPTPRIAVCGLNPHAGEGGRFGREEIETIAPAVGDARARGIVASGPFAADSLFHRAATGEFDAVLGMYHDQALGPLKVHAFGRGVNVTLGLPFIRTSVDHGTAFDIAGRGIADPGSMIEAIRLAGELVRNARKTRASRTG